MQKKVSKLLALVSALFLSIGPVNAETIDFRVDAQAGGSYSSNIAQIQDFPGDFISRFTTSGTFRYTAKTNTQVIARLQAQYNKFINISNFDAISLAASLNVSQWFWNSLNVYGGVQPIQLISTVNDRKPLDMLYLTGFTYYYPIKDTNTLLFGGYQLDRLQAQSVTFRSLNHTALVGARQPFTNNLIGNFNLRTRYRNLDTIDDDTRFQSNVNLQYVINSWLMFQVGGGYNYIMSKDQTRNNLGIYSVGIDLIGGYNKKFEF